MCKESQGKAGDSVRVCAVAPGVAEHRVGRGRLEVRREEQGGLDRWQCFRKARLQTEVEGGQKESRDPRGQWR